MEECPTTHAEHVTLRSFLVGRAFFPAIGVVRGERPVLTESGFKSVFLGWKESWVFASRCRMLRSRPRKAAV